MLTDISLGGVSLFRGASPRHEEAAGENGVFSRTTHVPFYGR